LASIVITVMGAALLRVSKLQDKWRVKLARSIESKDSAKRKTGESRFKLWCEKYAMFTLPFITVLREGLEAVVFIGGISLALPASSFPLALIAGIACGCLIGYLIYRSMTPIKNVMISMLTESIEGEMLPQSKSSLSSLRVSCTWSLLVCSPEQYGCSRRAR